MRATRALIRSQSLRRNLQRIAALVSRGRSASQVPAGTQSEPNTVAADTAVRVAASMQRLCLAVKADAYGHGLIEVARIAVGAGVRYLAVATVEEGIALRERAIAGSVFLYSHPMPDELPEVVHYGLTPLISSLELVRLVGKAAADQQTVAPVTLKIDTGMGRIGCAPADTVPIARAVADHPHLRLVGLSTHYAAADAPAGSDDAAFTQHQRRLFEACVAAVRSAGIDPGLVHAANSAGVLAAMDNGDDLVRPGILAYGYLPAAPETTRAHAALESALEPVMELRTNVAHLKTVPADTPISYGLTYRTTRTTTIATLPVGYADGYLRAYSNRAKVLIGGVAYPVVGRVCMDQCMVDLGPNAPVRLWDEAVLFGPDPRGENAWSLAAIAGTIAYEVTCAVSRRVPRITV